MSFRDEVNAFVKTPEQCADEQRRKSIDMGLNFAREDYEKIKTEIKEQSQSGKYKILNNKRIISFDYQYNSLNRFVWMEKAFFDGIIDKGIKCIIRDSVGLDAYKAELNRLSQEDDIRIQIKYVFRDDDGSEQCFDIPGIYSSLNKRNTCHVQRRSNCVLRCSFVL